MNFLVQKSLLQIGHDVMHMRTTSVSDAPWYRHVGTQRKQDGIKY